MFILTQHGEKRKISNSNLHASMVLTAIFMNIFSHSKVPVKYVLVPFPCRSREKIPHKKLNTCTISIIMQVTKLKFKQIQILTPHTYIHKFRKDIQMDIFTKA